MVHYHLFVRYFLWWYTHTMCYRSLMSLLQMMTRRPWQDCSHRHFIANMILLKLSNYSSYWCTATCSGCLQKLFFAINTNMTILQIVNRSSICVALFLPQLWDSKTYSRVCHKVRVTSITRSPTYWAKMMQTPGGAHARLHGQLLEQCSLGPHQCQKETDIIESL